MLVSNPSAFAPEIPTIDISEAVGRDFAAMIEKLGLDSPVSMVLRQARRELASLTQSATATVVGPFRVAA